MRRISVFCGSNSGMDAIYTTQAMALGRALAVDGIDLVYGGTKIGLMGAVADGALKAGGKVIGVLPYFLKEKEIAHQGLTQLILVDTMHERKTKMNELSDGVIALPGGVGTMEEFFEMLTWAQLGLHKKPIGLLNVDRFYDSLDTMVKTMVEKRFLKEAYRNILLISSEIGDLLSRMKSYEAPDLDKWISPEKL